ncbi:hypothetical protein RIF29_20402 [Crotalaria pallida]|uniref:acylphosphatase n=1 Tax=Crotalaria pallida TaxID=3830 RepID=A0AAN9F2W7_CROPI
MASSSSSSFFVSCPLIRLTPRFLLYRRCQNTKWNNVSGSVSRRLYHFNNSHASSSALPTPLCYPLLLSPHSLHLLCRSRQPHLRRPLSAMTTPHDSSPTKTDRVVIKGRVQGVFYRNWTMDNAKQLGLKGWVRNRRDGSVEALFSGSPDTVQEMEQRCRRGPPDAIVTGLEVFPSSDDPGTGFERKQTV